jgi:hypothetical protein
MRVNVIGATVAHGPSLLADAVAEALSGHHCISAWLGYGSALFLGFGSGPILAPHPNGRHPVPSFELQTSGADWRVGAISCDDERKLADRAVAGLVGQPVASWRLVGARALTVKFADGQTLEVTPPDELVPDLDEWWFCLPGSRFVGVNGMGQIIAGDSGYAADRGTTDNGVSRP